MKVDGGTLDVGVFTGVLSPREVLALSSVAPSLAADLSSGLARVEQGMMDATASKIPLSRGPAAGHLASAGGKRFRPLLVLLAAQFGNPQDSGVIPAAVVVELTHLATLYHDDVMDEAPRRRGAASANERWGNAVAILTGDYLFARASEIMADLGRRPSSFSRAPSNAWCPARSGRPSVPAKASIPSSTT